MWSTVPRSFRCFQRLATKTHQQVRFASSQRFNTVILFVPQQEAWIIERFGKYHKLLEPGLNFLLPVVDSVKYVQPLKEQFIEIESQSAITVDNVTLHLDGVLYYKIFDPIKASYGIEDCEFAIMQLAQTTMRSEIGKIELDTVFRERELLNVGIVDAINKATDTWGIRCLRYEIRDINVPKRVQEAMQSQVEAERKKRAAILESEGSRTSDINIAEGQKRARILQSEAFKSEKINQAEGEAEAILATAKARAKSIQMIAEALAAKHGHNAVSINVAEKYIEAFSNIAKEGNTLLLPSNTGDVSSMVAQALAIYKNVGQDTKLSRKFDEDVDTDSLNENVIEHSEKPDHF